MREDWEDTGEPQYCRCGHSLGQHQITSKLCFCLECACNTFRPLDVRPHYAGETCTCPGPASELDSWHAGLFCDACGHRGMKRLGHRIYRCEAMGCPRQGESRMLFVRDGTVFHVHIGTGLLMERRI